MCTLYDCLKITQVFNKMGQKCLENGKCSLCRYYSGNI